MLAKKIDDEALQGVTIRGRIGVRRHDVEDLQASLGLRRLSEREEYLASLVTPPDVWGHMRNAVLTGGVGAIITSLVGGSAYSLAGGVGYCAIGTSATAPTTSDTGLTAETGRYLITNSFRDGNYLRSSTFLSSAQANGGGSVTYQEAGLVNQAAGGTFLNHGLLSPVLIKTSAKTGTIDVDIQFAPS